MEPRVAHLNNCLASLLTNGTLCSVFPTWISPKYESAETPNFVPIFSSQVEVVLDENEESLDFILDEGLFVMRNVVPGVDQEVINIGVVEKG